MSSPRSGSPNPPRWTEPPTQTPQEAGLPAAFCFGQFLEQRIARSLRNLRGCRVLSPVLAMIEFALAGTAYILLALAFCLLGYLIFALGCRRLRHSLSTLLFA